jgi:hypothetical protein
MADKQSAADADVKQAVTYWLQTLQVSFLGTEIQAWCHGATNC